MLKAPAMDPTSKPFAAIHRRYILTQAHIVPLDKNTVSPATFKWVKTSSYTLHFNGVVVNTLASINVVALHPARLYLDGDCW